MTIDEYICNIADFNTFSASQLIPYFGYYIVVFKGNDFFLPKDIGECFDILRLTPYSNIASFLSKKSKGKNKLFIKTKQGYVIERNVSEQIAKNIGAKKAKTPSDALFPLELLNDTRGYIINMATQAILCYDYSLYDASLVMIRKLIETLIIELFECEGLSNNIKNKEGYFFYLSDLIDRLQNETKWNLSRNSIQSLPNIKKYGDLSAHNRRFNAKKPDMDKLKSDLRIVIEELIHLIDYPNRKK